MEGRYGRNKTFTPDAEQPDGIDWLAQLKGLLEMRFEDKVTDTTLLFCLDSAFEHVENVTGRVIRTGTMVVEYEAWVGRFPLPFLPCNEFTDVNDLDDEPIDYTQKGSTLTIKAADGCKIIYAAGYGDSCPKALQMAVLKTALTMYEVRSNIAIGTISSVLPQGANELMEPYILNQES
jgi:hypothetical protein